MSNLEFTFVPSEIIWMLVSFGLLFALLKWLIVPRLRVSLERRTRAIEAERGKAKQQQETTEEQREDYRRQLDKAADDAQRMIAQSEARVREQHARMMDEWKADMKQREEAFHAEAELTRQQAIREIRAEAAELSAEAGEGSLHGDTDGDEAIGKATGNKSRPRRH